MLDYSMGLAARLGLLLLSISSRLLGPSESVSSANQAKAPLPAKQGGRVGTLRSFVPAGYRVLMQRKADLNLDGRSDRILILAPRNEERFYAARTEMNVNELPPPRLLLLTGRPGNQYQLRVRNANATYRYGEDCNFRDSLDGLELGRGWFTITHYRGQITRTLRQTTFIYRPAAASWYLSDDEETMFYSMSPEEMQTECLLKRRVSLAHFNIHD